MIPHDREQGDGPSPQELAAFADGELEGMAAERLRDWLECHAEARAALDDHRRLTELWLSGMIPEPPAERWAEVFGRVERTLNLPVVRRRVGARRAVWISLALAATATAASLVLLLPNRPTARSPHPLPVAEEPYPVAGGDEVTIISIEKDRMIPLVGRSPLSEPLALAAMGDVKIESIEADEGMQPHLAGDADNAPMVVVPRPDSLRTP